MTKLNVILIAYKQDGFIRQALESILIQKTDFDFNIIVADDASPDKTLEIIKEIAHHSDKQFIFLDSLQNLGYTQNYKRAFAACKAPYIAIMEGDDFWTSPFHLQNHVTFLENNPDYMMSFNRHDRLFVDKGYNDIPKWEVHEDFETIEPQQLALGNRIGNLSCCVFRNIHVEDEVFDALFFADWLLGLYLGMYGKLVLQKEVTSAYRVHDNGQWSRMSEQEQYLTLLRMIEAYNPLLKFKYNTQFELYKKRIHIYLYGDKSFKGRIKNLIPSKIINTYKKWRYE